MNAAALYSSAAGMKSYNQQGNAEGTTEDKNSTNANQQQVNTDGTTADNGGNASPNTLGKQGEDFASNELGLSHNTTSIEINGRSRIPDFYAPDRGIIGESKNVDKLSYTRQLRDYVDKATEMGTSFELFVRQNTKLSKPLQEAIGKGLINIHYFPW